MNGHVPYRKAAKEEAVNGEHDATEWRNWIRGE
jgi:hypothetical protein